MTPETVGAAGLTVLVYPMYADNPWQRIVYEAFTANKGQIVVLRDLNELPAISAECRQRGRQTVLHLNWTAPISQAATSLGEATAAVSRATVALTDYVAGGGRIVWTIHNVLPHELHYFVPEVLLCRAIAALAETIVIMNPDTVELVRALYPLDASRVVQIDHPSYVGEFNGTISRHDAREQLGIHKDDTVGIFLGLIRPYKGLDSLVSAYDSLSTENQKLLVAGDIGPGYSEDEVSRMLSPRPFLVYRPGRLPDEDVQKWFAAADVAILPYRRGLNMSVVMLAATHGVPVAVRRIPETDYLVSEPWVSYIEGEGEELAESVMSAMAVLAGRADLREAAMKYAHSRIPAQISSQYLGVFTRRRDVEIS